MRKNTKKKQINRTKEKRDKLDDWSKISQIISAVCSVLISLGAYNVSKQSMKFNKWIYDQENIENVYLASNRIYVDEDINIEEVIKTGKVPINYSISIVNNGKTATSIIDTQIDYKIRQGFKAAPDIKEEGYDLSPKEIYIDEIKQDNNNPIISIDAGKKVQIKYVFEYRLAEDVYNLIELKYKNSRETIKLKEIEYYLYDNNIYNIYGAQDSDASLVWGDHYSDIGEFPTYDIYMKTIKGKNLTLEYDIYEKNQR